jgi:membrane protease YdiL (CAAX protease family)
MTTNTMLLIAAEWIGVIALGMLAVLSPQLQKIRPLQFLFPRREASVTFALNAAIFIFGIILYKYFFTTSTDITMINLEAGWQRIILDVTALLVLLAALLFRKQPIRSALWSKEGLKSGLQYGLLIAALIIFLRAKISAITNGVESMEGMALLQLLIIALCEVTIFFGYSQPRLSSRFGNNIGWLISAALFALWQIIPLALHGASGQAAISQVVLAIGYGAILGWITQKGRHVLGPAIYLALSQWLFLIK